ncbi:MAG: hypothetical protein GKR89_09495 [Candidatus Latescibacteria bacterium]|nr:hypothetical protein [Candidatus Latescibacterota bacterium]
MDTLWIIYWMALFLGGMPLLMALVGVFDEESLDIGASFRFLAFLKPLAFMLALFFFGLVGAGIRIFYETPMLSLWIGGASGLFFGWAGERIVGSLRREITDSSLGEQGLVGREAVVILPVGPQKQGKILCNLGHSTMEVLARPMEREASFAIDDQVLILDVEQGVALIAAEG